MKQYHNLLNKILANGEQRDDRTGTGTKAIFGEQIRFDLTQGFPLLTTKKMPFKAVLGELLWFIRGDTNIKFLNDNGINIWNEWANERGSVGAMYGFQWRAWRGVDNERKDQLSGVIRLIKKSPNSRRQIMATWNVDYLPDENLPPKDNPSKGNMALAPCHGLVTQFHVSNDGALSCQMYQRSADAFLGLPFNIASYAILTHMIAQLCGLKVGELIITLGDVHIYNNHIEQVELLLSREPIELPQLELNKEITDIGDFDFSDFELVGYNPHPAIKADVSI